MIEEETENKEGNIDLAEVGEEATKITTTTIAMNIKETEITINLGEIMNKRETEGESKMMNVNTDEDDRDLKVNHQ